MTEYSDLIIEKIFMSLYLNEYFNSDFEKISIINSLRLFFDMCDFRGYVESYEITKDDFEQYFKDSLKSKYPEKYELIELEFKEMENESEWFIIRSGEH